MPHPEHAVEDAHRPGHRRPGFFTSVLEGAGRSPRDRHRQARARRRPSVAAAVRRARAEGRRVRRGSARSSAAARPAPSWRCTRVMWSEHCSYKSLQGAPAAVRREGARSADALLVGMGENAGVVDVGDGWAVTFKVESHNHPSLRRAVPGRGDRRRRHRPRHPDDGRPAGRRDGPAAVRRRPTPPDTRRVLPGVVAGIGGYGNCLGLPNIGGEVVFDPSLPGQPAGQRAVRRRPAARRTSSSRTADGRRQPGRAVRRADRRRRHRRRVRARVSEPSTTTARPSGRACRSATRSRRSCSSSAASRSSPPTSSSASRTSAAPGCPARPPSWPRAGDGGMHVDLDRVPLRDATLAPEEILMSESQERMCAVVDARASSTRSWRSARSGTSLATVIGEVDRQRPARHRSGTARPIVDVPPRTVAHDGPVYERPFARPARPGRAAGRRRRRAAAPGDRRRAARDRCCSMVALAEPRVASRGSPSSTTATCWATPCSPSPRTPAWSGVDEETGLGVALAHRRQRPLHPARPVRRRAARAGRGLPQRRRHRRPAARGHQLPQLRLARGPRGDVAVRRGGPRPRRRLPASSASRSPAATSASTTRPATTAIHPTPVVGVLGVIDDVAPAYADGLPRRRATSCCCSARRATSSAARSGRTSCTATSAACRRAVDLRGRAGARRRCCVDGVARRPARQRAHDLSDGGLAQALVEMLPAPRRRRAGRAACRADPFVALFSESAARAVVAVPADRVAASRPAHDVGVPVTRLGTTGGETLAVQGVLTVGLDELRAASRGHPARPLRLAHVSTLLMQLCVIYGQRGSGVNFGGLVMATGPAAAAWPR